MGTKYVVGAVCGIVALVGVGSTAAAGEWAPGHGTTPIRDHVAASECAFSGSDEPDTTEEHGDDPPSDDGLWASTPGKGHAQSPGQMVAAGYLPPGVPGVACRGGGPAGG